MCPTASRTLIAQFSSKQEVTIPGSGPDEGGGKPGGAQGHILLVTVTNVQFPLTLEVVYQVPLPAGTRAAQGIEVFGNFATSPIRLALLRLSPLPPSSPPPRPPRQVFGMCGAIAKAVVFNRQGKDQTLVQFYRPQARLII